ncbi:MAG: hypothetical protein BGO76_02105 [Caedibacter sp. 38-128]|nr:hypothetical protein [Holosporales bacterium]OJX08533.1 MAG: hypothetical protein BGO76_02105 [Caedibacter sp. 38-128]
MRILKKCFYLFALGIIGSLSYFNFPSVASINETTWEMQDETGKLRTHPLNQNELPFWYELQGSPAATALFRDGRPRTQEECDPQAQRSIKRHLAGNPLVVHVVELNTPEFGWKPVGTIVIGGSDKENYFELAGLSHPAIIKSTGEYLKKVDKEERLQKKAGFDDNDPNLIPLWRKKYALSMAQLIVDQFLPIIRQTKVTGKGEYDFDGTIYRGIIATSSDPAAEKILKNLGFHRSEQMEMSRFGVMKWQFVLEFTDKQTA